VTFFHSELLLDNSASFTSSRTTDMKRNVSKMEGKTIFFEALETV